MSITTVPHLNFRGQARAALEHYHAVFGGQLLVTTYGDVGAPAEAPGADRVVFGQVIAENGFRIMAYDIPGEDRLVGTPTTRRENGATLTDEPFFVSVRGDGVEEVGALWKGLAAGATVVEEYGPSAWAPASGMLTDRFGVTWILDVAPNRPA